MHTAIKDNQPTSWDTQSLGDWLTKEVARPEAHMAITCGVRAVFAVEPAELSLLFFLFYAHAAGGVMPLFEVRGGAQERRLVGGAQQLSQRLAAPLAQQILLNHPVDTITQDAQSVTLSANHHQFQADYAIVAIPPHLAAQIRYSPAPPPRNQLARAMPMGRVIKCIVAYKQPFWRTQGMVGEAVAADGVACVIFDDSPHDASFGALVAFILGDMARTWGQRSRAERLRAITSQLTELFGPQAASPVAYLDHDWQQEQWSGGCYVGYAPPMALSDSLADLRTPYGRIHWAGTETATIWNGYMDGAIESGERAAEEIIARAG